MPKQGNGDAKLPIYRSNTLFSNLQHFHNPFRISLTWAIFGQQLSVFEAPVGINSHNPGLTYCTCVESPLWLWDTCSTYDKESVCFMSCFKYCETQPPASIGWVALSSVVVVRRHASVTSPLISTIWCFRAYKPYVFCEDMILSTCQCQHIFCCWVEPSLLLSSLY